jgi:hypothetical protein
LLGFIATLPLTFYHWNIKNLKRNTEQEKQKKSATFTASFPDGASFFSGSEYGFPLKPDS